jgi:hypothetical protein
MALWVHFKNLAAIVSSRCLSPCGLHCIWWQLVPFFGAGEPMALMAEQGLWYPTIVTSGIVIILFIWSLYGLSGSGAIKRLPLTRVALVIVSSIFLLRGVSFVSLMPLSPDKESENSLTFWLISSGICVFIGTLFAVGTYQQWSRLARDTA